MGDNRKEVPSSNFDLTGDGSGIYDSDSQLRTAIIRRLLNEYRTTNYFLANAMQSTFLRFFIHDSYSTISPPPEYNRPKSDSNYFEPKNSDHITIEELNIKSGQFNEYCCDNNNMRKLNEQRTDMIYGPSKNTKFAKNHGESFHSEFDTLSTNSQRDEESVLLTGRTMHVGGVYEENSCYSNRSSDTEKEFKFVDTDLNNQMQQQFDDKPSSVKSTESSEEDDAQRFTSFYPQWKEINKSKDKIEHSAHSSRREEKTISCSFNDSNRSSIDNYNDDTNNSSGRKESSCNKRKCKPSELVSKDVADKKSNNSDEYKIPPRRESKWQVFCELYEELNSSLKDENSDYTTSTESIKSRVKYCDSRKTSSHSSLERKINAAISKLKVKEPEVSKTKKNSKANENLRIKFGSHYNSKKPFYIDDTSSDTEEVLIRNRYLRNKRMYNTKKYFTNKFRKTNKKRRNNVDLQTTTTSSDDNDSYTPGQINNPDAQHHQTTLLKQFGQTKSEIPLFQQKYSENTPKMSQFQQKCTPETSHKVTQFQEKYIDTTHKMTQFQQKYAEIPHKMTQFQQVCAETSHKMNDKLIHETIFENSDEEPYTLSPFPSYFQTFMDKYNRNYALNHKKGSTNLAEKRYQQISSTITCDDYSKNNQSFIINPNETSCDQTNNSNVSIDKIANSGHSTSSLDSIDDISVPLPSLASNSEDTQRKHLEDLTKMSTSTICLKSSSGAVDSGLGASVSEIKPIENVFIIKKPPEEMDKKMFDEITVAAPESAAEKVSSNSSAEWSKICKAKFTVSKLPFRFSSSSKSKSSSENEETIKGKPKMRVIFKREATVIDLYNPISFEKTPVLCLNGKNGLHSGKKKRFHCLRKLFFCCSQ